MRFPIPILALALAACAPAAPPPASAPAADAEFASLPPAVTYGQWFFRGDGGYISTCYGAPESECAVTIQCEAPTGRITLSTGHELSPDQETRIRLVTATQTLDLPAQSMNEGLPNVSGTYAADSADAAALRAALGPAQQHFGVAVAGQLNVFPWDESIARTLAGCAG